MELMRQQFLEECLRCPSVNGKEIRHAVSQGCEFDDRQLSPSGRPLQCCRIRTVTAISREQGTPAGGGIAVNNYGPPPRGLRTKALKARR
jgi:hypothetical protein